MKDKTLVNFAFKYFLWLVIFNSIFDFFCWNLSNLTLRFTSINFAMLRLELIFYLLIPILVDRLLTKSGKVIIGYLINLFIRFLCLALAMVLFWGIYGNIVMKKLIQIWYAKGFDVGLENYNSKSIFILILELISILIIVTLGWLMAQKSRRDHAAHL